MKHVFLLRFFAVPDWCVRCAHAPLGGKRGDEGGTLRKVRCPGRMRAFDHAHEAGPGSVDHTVKKLPSLFAAVVVDDTQFEAVGKCHQVLQQLQLAIRLFTEHVEDVAGLVVSTKKLEFITNDERIRTDVRNKRARGK